MPDERRGVSSGWTPPRPARTSSEVSGTVWKGHRVRGLWVELDNVPSLFLGTGVPNLTASVVPAPACAGSYTLEDQNLPPDAGASITTLQTVTQPVTVDPGTLTPCVGAPTITILPGDPALSASTTLRFGTRVVAGASLSLSAMPPPVGPK